MTTLTRTAPTASPDRAVRLAPESIDRVLGCVRHADDEHGVRACFAVAEELASCEHTTALRDIRLPESQWCRIAQAVVERSEDLVPGSGQLVLADWYRLGPTAVPGL